MLSAIAARKAAQAAQPPKDTGGNSSSPRGPSPPSSSLESDQGGEPLPPPRKRKAQEPDSPRTKGLKKKAKFTRASFGRPRYFEATQPIQGFDDEPSFDSQNLNQSSRKTRAYSPSRPITNIEPALDENLLSNSTSEAPGPNRGFSPSRPVLDSSEDENEENHAGPSEPGPLFPSEGPKSRRTIFTPRLDSNFFPLTSADLHLLQIASDTFRSNDATLLLLQPGHSLSFVGTASITLLQGAITVLGTPITPSLHAHRIFSPRSSPLASLEAVDSDGSPASSLLTLPNGGTLPPKIQNAASVSDSIVVIQRLQTSVAGLGDICRTFDGVFDIDSELREFEAGSVGVAGFQLVNPHIRPHPQLQSFFLPESWADALDTQLPLDESAMASLNSSFIAMVRGPKKCGKSTFARTLLNRLTTRYHHVAFLECDLGQSEFTPGGMVSLHIVSNPVFGPPFTHPRLPYRAHYVGNTTPHSNPSHYLSCIQALIQTYRMDVQHAYEENLAPNEGFENDHRIGGLVPLVVNTHGWIKGLGGDLLRKIEEMVEATHIFDLDVQTSALPPQRAQPSGTNVHVLQQIPTSPLAAFYTPADHRSLAILSYFHCVFPLGHPRSDVVQWITHLPLCARPPWGIDCREAIDQIVLIGAGYEDVVPQELGRTINCSVVALVCDEDPTASYDDGVHMDSSFPYTQGASPPDPNTSFCVGLAIVRGIDAASHTLQLLTPLPLGELARSRIMVKGELELPVWGMLDFRDGQDGVAGVPWGKVPYLQMGGGVGATGAGAGRKRVRRNLMRRAQM